MSTEVTRSSLFAERFLRICLQVVNPTSVCRRTEVAHPAKIDARGWATTAAPLFVEESASCGPVGCLEPAAGPISQRFDEIEHCPLVRANKLWKARWLARISRDYKASPLPSESLFSSPHPLTV